MAICTLRSKLNKILIGTLAVLSVHATWAACTNLEYRADYYTGPATSPFSSDGFTGVGPFDTGACVLGSTAHKPGEDVCPYDNVVRTNDTAGAVLTYTIRAPSTETNFTVKSTIPQVAGKTVAVWTGVPAACVGPGSALSDGGRTLVCNLGTITRGAGEGDLTAAIVPVMRFNGLGLNGERVLVNSSLSTDSCAAAPKVADLTALEISSKPKVDMKADVLQSKDPFQLNGVPGYLVSFYIYADSDGIPKGGEAVQSPLNFETILGGAPAGTVIYDCQNFDYTALTCPATGTPVQPGVPIPLSLSPTNSACNQFLQPGGTDGNCGFTNGSNRLGTNAIRYFIPESSINGQVNLRSEISNTGGPTTNDAISTPGLSGTPAKESNTDNNFLDYTLVGSGPGNLYKYMASVGDGVHPGNGNGGTSYVGVTSLSESPFNWCDSGTCLGYPGQTVQSLLRYNTLRSQPELNVIVCDRFDNKGVSLVETPPGSGQAMAPRNGSSFTAASTPNGYTFEYASVPADTNPALSITGPTGLPPLTQGCADADATWYPSTNAVPGGIAAINMVRIKIPKLVSAAVDPAANGLADFYVYQKVLPRQSGTIVGNRLGVYAPSFVSASNPQGKDLGAYDPPSNSDVGRGKRFKVTNGIVRVEKGTVGDITNILAGGTASYVIKPRVESLINGAPPTAVTVRDTLPPPLVYITGSAIFVGGGPAAPDAVVVNTAVDTPNPGPAGQTTIIWTYPSVVPNSAMAAIQFDAKVPLTTPNGTQPINKVVVSSPVDPSDEAVRTAFKGISIDNNPGFYVNKGVQAPQINRNGVGVYRLEIANLRNTPANNIDLIDILPIGSSEGRTPATNFAGTQVLAAAIVAPAGGTVYYTSSAPGAAPIAGATSALGNTAVDSDYAIAATKANGWCTAAELGTAGCPSLASAKAFRVLIPTIAGQQVLSFDLPIQTNGNAIDNVYTNKFSLKPGTGSLLRSNDVSIVVKQGSLSGRVYRDTDGNATQGAPGSEPPIAGVTITLCRLAAVPCTGTNIVGTRTTNISGDYVFNDLFAGSYFIQESQPAGYANGPNNAAGNLGGTPAVNAYNAITVPVGGNGVNYNFGERGTDLATKVTLPTTPANPGEIISGTVNFANVSGVDGQNTTMTIKLSPGLPTGAVVITPPAGYQITTPYNPATGEVVITPVAPGGVFTAGASINVGVAITAPINGTAITLSSKIENSLLDDTPIFTQGSPDPKRNVDQASITLNTQKIDIRKRAGTPKQNPLNAAEFDVGYSFVVANRSNILDTKVQAVDNFQSTFPGATSIAVQPGIVRAFVAGTSTLPAPTVACAAPIPEFDGGLTAGNIKLFDGNFDLRPGDSCSVQLIVRVTYPNVGAVPQNAQLNTAYATTASGTAPNLGLAVNNSGVITATPSNTIANDTSTDNPLVPPQTAAQLGTAPPAPPPPSGPNTDAADPTPVSFAQQLIDVRKSATTPVQVDTAGRKFKIGYAFTIENTGLVPATNVQASENLLFTYPAPAVFTVTGLALQPGSDVACNGQLNTAFNGAASGSSAANHNIFGASGLSSMTLPAGTFCKVQFVVNIDYAAGTVPTIPPQNRIFASTATGPNSGPPFDATGTTTGDNPLLIVKDTSTAVNAPAGSAPGVPPAAPAPLTNANAKSDSGSGVLAPIATLETLKQLTSPPVILALNRYKVDYKVSVKAIGTPGIVLPNVQAVDSLANTFNAGAPSLSMTGTFAASATGGGACTGNAAFGPTDIRLLSGLDNWTAGQGCEFTFSVIVQYPSSDAVPASQQNNSVWASSVGGTGANPGGSVNPADPNPLTAWTNPTAAGQPAANRPLIAHDRSTDHTNTPQTNTPAAFPATSAGDTPQPTPVTFNRASPIIGVKYVENVTLPGSQPIAGHTIRWSVNYYNPGPVTMTNFQIRDAMDSKLQQATITSVLPTSVGGSISSAPFTANPAYTGVGANTALLQPGSTLAANTTMTVFITAVVRSTATGAIGNQAFAEATELGGSAGTKVPTSAVDATTPPCPNPVAANSCIPSNIKVPPKAVGGQPVAKDQPNVLTVAVPGGISGYVWIDADKSKGTGPATPGSNNAAEQPVLGFRVAVYAIDPVTGERIREMTDPNNRPVTAADGSYTVSNLPPSTGPTAPRYEVVFFNETGTTIMGSPDAASGPAGTTGSLSPKKDKITGIQVLPATITPQQNLPLDPSGVVYDTVSRRPIPGATVRLIGPNGQPVPPADLLGGSNTIVTGPSGIYQFILNTTAPAGDYRLEVVSAPTGYNTLSQVISPDPGPVTPGSAALCPGLVAGQFCQVQPQPGAPQVGANPSTVYYLSFKFTPGSSPEVIHNHIPLDPTGNISLAISKVADRTTAEIGDPVKYTIRVKNLSNSVIPNVTVQDTLPLGFKLVPNTVRTVSTPATVLPNPTGGVGPVLTFNVGNLSNVAPGNEVLFSYYVRIGVGGQDGDGINRAFAQSGTVKSLTAQAQVKVSGGVFTREACLIGKVFVDCGADGVGYGNGNGIQDVGEPGVPGIRLYLEDGSYVVTDSEGKYSLCGLKATTHILKVDETTLPPGARLGTTANRNGGDPSSLFIDLKIGELHRADFRDMSCNRAVFDEVKRRRDAAPKNTSGEVRVPKVEGETQRGSGIGVQPGGGVGGTGSGATQGGTYPWGVPK